MRRLIPAALAAALTITLAAPAASATPRSAGPDLVQRAVALSGGAVAFDDDHRDFDILVKAVVVTGADAVLSDPSLQLTVFAPDDRAFMRLVEDVTGSMPASEDAAFAAVAGLGVPGVLDVLLYHVTPGSLTPGAVVAAGRAGGLTMADGGTVTPQARTLVDEGAAFQDPSLIPGEVNIKASNGVIHAIDRVLIPAGFPLSPAT